MARGPWHLAAGGASTGGAVDARRRPAGARAGIPTGAALPRGGRPSKLLRMGETTASIRITVNGDTREVPSGTSVADLLGTLGLDIRKVAVERNLEIVPRSTYAATALGAGDQLEIVHFIGGG